MSGRRPRPGLDAALSRAASAPVLLVASDFDGTLAPISADPALVGAEPGSVETLAALAALPHTHAAIISGRSYHDLQRFTGAPPGVHLIGSHGGEAGPGLILPPDAAALRDRLIAELTGLAALGPGLLAEVKPAGVAFHYRNADPLLADRALEELKAGPMTLPGVWPKQGKMVVELSVIPANKGAALERLRDQLGAACVVFVGDDLTDEDAFARMGEDDLSVKVGPGETAATCRVATTSDVARMYERLLELRAARAALAGR